MAQPGQPMISLENVSKRFNGADALEPTSLDFKRNESTILIGPSGCGKSTILRLIIGLLQPTTGRILFEGDVVSLENIIKIRRRIGYVIQEGGLFPHLTAEQNILLMAKYLSFPPEQMQSRMEELRELTRLPRESLSHYPLELSGGQRQRVSLIRALMLKPDVLLLDEPLGALDPMVRFRLQTELKEIFRQLRQTIVMVTHDMAEAAFFGDTIVLLKKGRIVQQGALSDLRDQPAEPFVSEFLNAQRSRALL